MTRYQIKGARILLSSWYGSDQSTAEPMGTFWVTDARKIGDFFTLSGQCGIGWADTSTYNEISAAAARGMGQYIAPDGSAATLEYLMGYGGGYINGITKIVNTVVEAQTGIPDMIRWENYNAVINAALEFALRKRRIDRLFYACESVSADDENVLYTAIFQLIQNAEPIFGTLIFADMYGQNLLVTGQTDSLDHICSELPDLSIISYRKVYCINENDGIYRIKWALLPILDLRKKAVCDVRNHAVADLKTIDMTTLSILM